nr:type VI secretion system tip protein VgrG [uncultured Psychroserpens sp.]
MSVNTNIKSGGLVTFSIKVNGKSIPDTLDVKSLEIEKSVNRISVARISIVDGNPSTGKFEVSSSNDFVPGNEVIIEAGYDSKDSVLFKGIITKQSIKVHGNEGAVLQVECRDSAIKMLVGRKSVAYSKKKDSDIMTSIIGNYSGLSAKVSATTTEWPEQIQYYTSDWDFMLARAEANGMIVTTLNGEVSVFPPNKNTTPVLEIEYGTNMLEFNADLNSVNQFGSVKGSSWDYETQKIIDATSGSNLKGPGNLSSKKLSEVVGLKAYELQTTAPLNEPELNNWAQAELLKSEYAKIQGDVKFQGSSLVAPGTYITLGGLGDRFNGDHLISRVVHEIGDGNWITQVSVGLSNVWSTEEHDVMAPPAAGLLPGVQGLFNGTVKKIYEDPDNQYRILVDVPLFDPKGEGIWARLTNFYATSGAGVFFLPEIGDEVVLGFLNEDPRFPIILGSLYSSTKNTPFKGLHPDEKNSKKAIVSKSKMQMEFDDENIVLTLATPNKNQAVFSDKDKTITIKDENGNSIEMDATGITIKSSKNISIEASEKLTLKGQTGVEILSSGGDVDIKGLNVNNKAQIKYSANGGTEAELNGGAQTTIKGAMVMIN